MAISEPGLQARTISENLQYCYFFTEPGGHLYLFWTQELRLSIYRDALTARFHVELLLNKLSRHSKRQANQTPVNHLRPISMNRVYFLSFSSPLKRNSAKGACRSKSTSAGTQLTCSSQLK
jgi:hypothetical protein